MIRNTVEHIQWELADLYKKEQFVTDKSGVNMIELIGTSFVADEPLIFGEVNEDYVKRELDWYLSQSLYVKDIPGTTPAIWNQVADKDGLINSNYGFLVFGFGNYSQYANVREELKKNPYSRRATMIYTRPSMHYDYKRNGMSDFICTNAVNYVIRNGLLHATVQMRSNDVWAGYRNDYAWQKYVLNKLASDLDVDVGEIYWNAASLHVYSRQFHLLDHFIKTDYTEIHISKKDYLEKYGNEPYGV